MITVTLHVGHVRDVMSRMIADGDRYDQLITSPPFWEQRDYLPADHEHKAQEIGKEPSPAEFLDTQFELTKLYGELIPEWGSICVELGDTQSGSGGAGGDYNTNGLRAGQPKFRQGKTGTPLAKSACGIPQGYYLGLIYGRNPISGTESPAGEWRARNWVVWARPNPSPGSLGKRNPQKRTGDYKFRPACSYITVACRGTGRYFDLDAVRTEPLRADNNRLNTHQSTTGARADDGQVFYNNGHPAGAPPLDWHTDHLDGDWLWKLATAPYPGAHYATYPLTLPRRLILAMCPSAVCIVCGWPRERVTHYERSVLSERNGYSIDAQPGGSRLHSSKGGTGIKIERDTLGFTDCGHDNYRPGRVLDPFAGSGTTAVAAALEGRDCTLIDLDPRNVDLIRRRLAEVLLVHNETVDGNTITWTVTAEPDSIRKAVATGQLSLFAEGLGA